MVVLTWRCSSKNWERFWYMFWVCTPDSHTVTNVCFLTSLLMRSSNFRSTECSGHFTWNCSWQTMKYQPGNWMTRFPSWYLTPWTMPSLFQDNLLLFICFDTAKRMTKKKQKKPGLLSTFQMQVGKFEVFFQVSPFKTHVFCTVACCSSHMEYLPCYSFYMLFAISGRGTKPPLFLFSNAESWRVTWHWTTTFYGIVFLWMIILCHSVIIIIIIFPFSGYKFLDYILHKF